jgi:membrane protein
MRLPLVPLVTETLTGWWEDKAPRLGAALAYYTVLALAPVVIFTAPLAGRIFGRDAARKRIELEFLNLVGQQGAEAVRVVLSAPGPWAGPSFGTTMLSLAVLLFAASGVFAQLQDALDTIWGVTPKPGRAAVLSFLRKRFLSFAMVLGICFLLLVSLVVSAGLSAVQAYAVGEFKSLVILWTVAHAVVSFVVATVLFALIFKVLPDVKITWHDVGMGAAITSLLFSAGRFLIGTYLGRASYGRSYGTAGSLVALLAWVYSSSQILYLGAEFTKVYARHRGRRVKPTVDAMPVTAEARAQQGLPPTSVSPVTRGRS